MTRPPTDSESSRPRNYALVLTGATTLGLVVAFNFCAVQILPDLEWGTGGATKTIFGGSLTLSALAIYTAQGSAVLAAALLLRVFRKDRFARPASIGSMLNVVNVILGANVAFCAVVMLPSGPSPLPRPGKTHRLGFSEAWPSTMSMADRCEALTRIAQERVHVGEVESAEIYALELRRILPRCEHAYDDYGWAVVTMNTVLGRNALQRGNVPRAAAYLEAAGDAPPSPQLLKDGPAMSLAYHLLLAGQRDAVLDYLTKSGRLWPKGAAPLERWRRQVARGVNPNAFGWERR